MHMAGKKGMKHARPRTQEERDVYATSRIEHVIDTFAEKYLLHCAKCREEIDLKDIPAAMATLLKARYDKLKPTKTEATITHRTHWTDAITRVSQADQQVTPTPAVDEDRPAVH
jgi:hypothetical protein